MKYVQAGILACLIVIAGLLFGIYSGQQTSPPDEAAQAPLPIELAVASQPVAQPNAEPAAAASEAKPSPLPTQRAKRRPPEARRAPEPPATDAPAESAAAEQPLDAATAPPPISEPVIPNLPPLVGMPQPEPLPRQQLVTVPEGAEIVVRLVNTLSTNRNRTGDSFEATLEEPLQVDGWLVAPKGSKVEGRVLESTQGGRVKGVAELSFDLVRLTTAGGKALEISTLPFGEAAEKSRGDDLKKVGWGAGLGAVIGAIAGGGKGAAIGAGAGAGAGMGTVLATRGKTAVVPTETRLTFRLTQPLEVVSTKPVKL